jgi:hypothetical protein
MEQHKFIWLAKNMKVENVTQGTNGETTIELRPNINIVHDYRRKNQMTIRLLEREEKYIIPSEKELERIYRLHLEHKDIMVPLMEYCAQLEKV